ncbi:hypothetical protein EfmGK961_19650 [Enterococcus faecium]|nr:hypothetical protein EfmGK961_19650 [Enterococcus faecium]
MVGLEAQAAKLKLVLADTISKDTKLTNNVDFVSLDETPQEWAKKYQKHDYPRINRNNTTAFKIFRAIINRCLRMIKLPPKIRHHKFDLYHGSQWWALSKECLTELIQMYEQNQQDYLNFKIGMFAPGYRTIY